MILPLLWLAPAWSGGPLYTRIPDAFDPQPCGGAGCWSHHTRLVDLDGDGDLDVLFANHPDFFNGSDAPQPLALYVNDGDGGYTPELGAVGDHVGNHRQIAVGDVDADGDLDLYAPDAVGLHQALFINDGDGGFVDEAAQRLPDPAPRAAAARLGDLDGDGDLDLFTSDAYASDGPPFARLYLNDGSGTFTEAPDALPDTFDGVDIDDVELVDVDRDFDLDLVLNAHSGVVAVWRNDGSGQFTADPALPPPVTPSLHYNVAPCDVDGDGDLDLWIDNIGGDLTEQLLINDGTGAFTDETSARVSGNPSADDNGVICVDYDHDGDFDAVVLSLSSPERLLINDGDGRFTYAPGLLPPPTDCTLGGAFGDVDGDDRLDLVTAQGECSSSNELYLAAPLLPPDTRPPQILAIQDVDDPEQGGTSALRFAVADSATSDDGPRLHRAWIVLDPEGFAAERTASFVGGDLFRVELPGLDPGEVVYRICAEDPAGNVDCTADRVYTVLGEPTDTEPTDTEPTDTGSQPPDDRGCGCAAPGAPGWLPLLAVLAVGLRRPRSAG